MNFSSRHDRRKLLYRSSNVDLEKEKKTKRKKVFFFRSYHLKKNLKVKK